MGDRQGLSGYTQELRPGSGERLRDYLARQIEPLGDPAERAARTERYGQSWRLMASPDPAHASVSWTEPDGTRVILEFEAEAEPAALEACGVAWEDTLAYRPAGQLALPAPGTGNTTAGAKQNEAPSPQRSPRPRVVEPAEAGSGYFPL